MTQLSKLKDAFESNLDYKYLGYFLGGLGLSILLYSKWKSSYVYPNQIDYSKHHKQLGANKKEFMAKLKANHEKVLDLLKNIYPQTCTIDLDRSLFCSKKIVFLNSIKAVKKYSSQDGVSDRPKNFLFECVSDGYLGSFFRMYDEKLLEIRKSSVTGLHKLMNGQFESKLVDELTFFIDYLNEKMESRHAKGVLENAPLHIQQISTNMILRIGLNARFEYEIDYNSAIKEQINNITTLLSSLNIMEMDEFKQYHAYTNKDYFVYISRKLNGIYQFLNGALGEYKKSFDPSYIETFADYVLNKQFEKLAAKMKLEKNDNYSDEDIKVQFFTLFMAGAVTLGFTLAWAFYYLAKEDEIQTNIFNEINSKFGVGRLLETRDIAQLPYTEACIHEILRLSSTQPLITRANQNDLIIDENLIKSGTTIVFNAYSIHRDPEYWPNPIEFKPERWLNEEKKFNPIQGSFIPFGTSPRTCIGDGLSKQILFLVITNIVQRFKFELSSSNENPKLGIMRHPGRYDLKISPRL
jgi:hypothetical protein